MAYQLDEKHDIRNQNLVAETVVLTDGGCHGLVSSSLTNGVLKLSQSKGPALVVMSTVKNCEVVAVRRQRGFDFSSARFIGCKFHGVYSDVDFGARGRGDPIEDFGIVDACDFTAATLDGCRFFNADVSTLRFPPWPHVMLLDFAKRAQEVAAASWPGELGTLMHICADQPISVRAVVIHVPSFAQHVSCSEEQVRDAFEKFGGVLM